MLYSKCLRDKCQYLMYMSHCDKMRQRLVAKYLYTVIYLPVVVIADISGDASKQF